MATKAKDVLRILKEFTHHYAEMGWHFDEFMVALRQLADATEDERLYNILYELREIYKVMEYEIVPELDEIIEELEEKIKKGDI